MTMNRRKKKRRCWRPPRKSEKYSRPCKNLASEHLSLSDASNEKRHNKEKQAMRNNEEIMPAEEFFGEFDKEMNAPSMKTRPRGKRKPDDLFADMKVKMVMRIYKV